MKVIASSALLIFLGGILVAAAAGQTPPKTDPTLTPEEQELRKAQRANEDAQADYYREQANKLRQPPPPEKTFSQSVAENPASVIGVGGTIVGAIVVASVSLMTLYFNSRNAVKAQRDTQFYEALKRMGDKDSPTIRVSAAGLLAQMAQGEWRDISFGKKWPFLKLVRSRPYLATSVDQLLFGHLLEETPVGIESIESALRQLMPHDLQAITHRLYAANLSLQDELASLVAEFFVLNDLKALSDLYGPEARKELWEQLPASAGYKSHTLRKLAEHSTSFANSFSNYRRVLDAQETGDRGQFLASLNERLRVASNRLRANVALFSAALGDLQPKDAPPREGSAFHAFSFVRSFLVGGKIAPDANLSDIDFADSNFDGLVLIRVNLTKALLTGASLNVQMKGGSLRDAGLLFAQLREAKWRGVDMTDARLAGADINRLTTLSCNWWKADFGKGAPAEVDDKLLESLFERGGQYVPEDLDEVHATVRTFIESRRAKSAPVQSA